MDLRQNTGVPGLDAVLGGGLLTSSCTLLSGAAGTGKTTLGLHFLLAGVAAGEGGVYFTFEEFPEQIYRDGAAFGWDIPAMEQAGKLQIVSLPPDAFMLEAEAVDGLLEELRAGIGMRRAVIDSLNLLANPSVQGESARQRFYRLRNAFRRMGVTTLFLHEQTGGTGSTVDEFVADTVVYLSYDNLDGHRLRHLEVRKHRGSGFLPGQHTFVFASTGLRVLPALSRIPDLTGSDVIPTGLDNLDSCLGGGVPRGSTFVFNVNSKCNYRFLFGGIVAAHLQRGCGLINTRSSMSSPNEIAATMALYGIDMRRLGAEGRWLAMDSNERPVPADIDPYVLRINEADPETGLRSAHAVNARFRREEGGADHWLLTADFNTALISRGDDLVAKYWTQIGSAARYYGHTIIATCNFEEMSSTTASFIHRTANGILRTWFDGRYQYLQVQKAPNGRVSEPMVVEYVEEPPFFRLW